MKADCRKDIALLLDAEKVALMTANYNALGPLQQRKTAALSLLARQSNSREVLEVIRAKIDENQALVTAAISGITAARKRLDALNDVQSGLTVYDQSGKMAVVSAKPAAFEKKA